MARVSLELFKKHVRSDDFEDDDVYLQHVLEAAQAYVETLTGYSAEELGVIPDERFPAPLKQAILMRGAALYAYREDVDNASLSAVPYSLAALVKPYQRMYGGGLLESLVQEYSTPSAPSDSIPEEP